VPLAAVAPIAATTAALAVLLLALGWARLATRAGAAALGHTSLLLWPALTLTLTILVARTIFVARAILVPWTIFVPWAIFVPRAPLFAGTRLVATPVPFAALASSLSLRSVLPGRAFAASAVLTIAAERPPVGTPIPSLESLAALAPLLRLRAHRRGSRRLHLRCGRRAAEPAEDRVDDT
jgi:hypothetical protein